MAADCIPETEDDEFILKYIRSADVSTIAASVATTSLVYVSNSAVINFEKILSSYIQSLP